MKKFFKKIIDYDYSECISLKNRLNFVFLIFIIIFISLIIRLFYVSLFLKNRNNIILANNESDNEKRISIVDRNGVLLATDINLVNFYLNRELVINPEKTSRIINDIIPEVDGEKLYKKLINTQNKAKFILVKKNITPKQQELIKNSGVIGFEFMNSSGRIYPHKNLFSHVVGYVNIDKQGVAGLEGQYNDYLQNPKNSPLKLTLDIRVQSILRQQLIKGMQKYNAKSIIGIVSEIKTGNILALVNLPDFDPNRPYYFDKNILYNKATYGSYEMGSVFKVFTIALGLDKNIIKTSDIFDVSQVISYGKYEVKQDHYSKRYMTPNEILEKSSNVGAALIGLQIGGDKMKDFLDDIGMFDKVHVNFPSLARPLVPKKWRDINTVTISYGHGIAVTPLHIVMGITGIVNDGVMEMPKFVIGENSREDGKRIISEKTSKVMREYLRNVVKDGTGWRANSLGYCVGGKTGSARLLKDGEYQEGNILANFVGIFPMNDPHFLVYIMVESPKIEGVSGNDLESGLVAAPIFARIIEQMAPVLNVVPYVERID